MDAGGDGSDAERVFLGSGMPDYITAHGEEIWGVDWFAPAMVRSNMRGELLDWGERPFGFSPVAWDGERVWALDPEGQRICQVERTR
jgi:hypothetical protein